MGNLELQCAACGTSLDALDAASDTCPSCGAQNILESATIEHTLPDTLTMNDEMNDAEFQTTGVRASTLLEFPGVAVRPQWRKDLSERVREYQKKRAHEAAHEATANGTPIPASATNVALGLVPPAEPRPMDKRVVKALKRIERARNAPPPAPSPTPRIIRERGAATTAAATARAIMLEPQTDAPFANPEPHALTEQTHAPLTPPSSSPEEPKPQSRVMLQVVTNTTAPTDALQHVNESHASTAEAMTEIEAQTTLRDDYQAREATLAVVSESTISTSTSTLDTSFVDEPTALPDVSPAMNSDVAERIEAATCEENATPKQTPRRVCAAVIDDSYLARREAETLTRYQVEQKDERAPLFSRFAASIIDWLLVAAISAGIVFLLHPTKINLHDVTLLETAGGITIALAILYSTFALTLAGRTFGMKLFSLNVINARDGFTPTFFRSLLRAVSYLFALAVCGFGIFYTLIDDERRALHDHFAGTIVVKTTVSG